MFTAGLFAVAETWKQPKLCVCVCVCTHSARAHCPMPIEDNSMVPAFEKRMSFIVRLNSKETEDRSQVCLPSPTFGVKFKGSRKFQTWKLIG